MLKYESLSEEMARRIEYDRASGAMPTMGAQDDAAVRRDGARNTGNVVRPAFVRDIDAIMHCPYYNRYADKTQVFSFYKNDDITRRALHVQLVSRIARTIGRALNLNADLIEAIALGHDIGHTPFGHAGETYLDELLYAHTGRHFSHNVHSVRVLDTIYPVNLSLQVLNGIAAHDGELELCEYHPKPLSGFAEFDKQLEACYLDKGNVRRLTPATLEGCVMRIADIIAYLGKDRQDAERAELIDNSAFADGMLGTYNAEILNNLMINIVENSYGQPYIAMDEAHFEALKQAKTDNYTLIYKNSAVRDVLEHRVRPMMGELYERLLRDLRDGCTDSPIFTHHIAFIENAHYPRAVPYANTEPHQLVTDYIASMTDDYFIDLYAHLFPDSAMTIEYKGYFE